MAVTHKPSWEATDPPVVVASRVPGADFKLKMGGYLPYQNPKLSANVAGNLEVPQEQIKKEGAGRERKAAVDDKEAVFFESYKQWERDAYTRDKQVTKKTNGAKERAEMNLARCGYRFEIDPRFNGEHAALVYI